MILKALETSLLTAVVKNSLMNLCTSSAYSGVATFPIFL